MKKGDKITATMVKTERSVTFGGVEMAGTNMGTFAVEKDKNGVVETACGRLFRQRDFNIKKV